MLIPGIPIPGAQQDPFKPERRIKSGAIEGMAENPLSELPVEEQFPQQHGEGRQPQEQAPQAMEEAEAAADTAPSAELPRKGLLVDIRA